MLIFKTILNYAKEESGCRQGSECGMIVSLPHSASSELASGAGSRFLTGSNSYLVLLVTPFRISKLLQIYSLYATKLHID